MKLNKILTGIGAVVCTSLLGTELSMLTKQLWALFGLDICLSPTNVLDQILRSRFALVQA